MTIKHWHALIAHEAIVESTVTLLDIEFPTDLLSPTQTTTNKIMEIINSKPQADRVHHTQNHRVFEAIKTTYNRNYAYFMTTIT